MITNPLKEIGRNPNVDWTVIIIISLVITTALAIQGSNLYNAVTRGGFENTSVVTGRKDKEFNDKAVSAVIERFDVKAEATVKARAGSVGVGDPSI